MIGFHESGSKRRLSPGADVNALTKDGETPPDLAIEHGYLTIGLF